MSDHQVTLLLCVCGVTWKEQGDASCADPLVLGTVGEGAQAEHHAGEAAQHRQQHKGPGGVPEGWKPKQVRRTKTATQT